MSVGVSAEAKRGLRWGAFGLAIITGIVTLASDPADARSKRKRSSYNPPYASIVVDANSGAVLQAAHADSQRHPASLTKIMTLYLLFERLEGGKLKLNSRLPVSSHAAAQAPTKLGLKPGQTLDVEDAILALVTKSANDAAVVVAEAIGGTESGFARMMTRKARALGMRRTTYTNASGLPDSDQVTTARDQALLGRAVQERFPRYYRYFATEAFAFRGRSMRNHNRLLGRVEGVDGIKTGYTRASGFNLVTSVRRGRRHIVAVVLGGRSAGKRDAQMRELLSDHIMTASIRRTAPAIAEAPMERKKEYIALAGKAVPLPPEKPDEPDRQVTDATASIVSEALPDPVVLVARPNQPQPGSTAPIKPVLVKTVSVKPPPRVARKTFTAEAAQPESSSVPLPPTPPAAAEPPASTAAEVVETGIRQDADTSSGKAAAEKAQRSGWIIQVGAFDEEKEARVRLNSVQDRAKKLLSDADPFTEAVTKGRKTLYRARFAGLEKKQAEAACRVLKRRDIACLALKH
jgi:D-alanyl-D-alanine carboxypeptidase